MGTGLAAPALPSPFPNMATSLEPRREAVRSPASRAWMNQGLKSTV